MIKTLDNKAYKKDTEKGQKIVAAGYLITRHLSDTDTLKDKIRKHIVSFVCASGVEQEEFRYQIEVLLGGAAMAGVINEKNTSILIYEMKRYTEHLADIHTGNTATFETLFSSEISTTKAGPLAIKDNNKNSFYKGQDKSHTQQHASIKDSTVDLKDSTKNSQRIINKMSRQDSILSLINDRKSAVIKDITSLFPDVSEKTIQRELNSLIDSGRITKRGSKRWSIYMAVNSLL